MRFFRFFREKKPSSEKVNKHMSRSDAMPLRNYLAYKDLSSDPNSFHYLITGIHLGPGYEQHLSTLLHHGANPSHKMIYQSAIVRGNHAALAILFSHGMTHETNTVKPSACEEFKAIINWCNATYAMFHDLSECIKLLKMNLASGHYNSAVEVYHQVTGMIEQLPDGISSDLYAYPIEQYAQQLQALENSQMQNDEVDQKLL